MNENNQLKAFIAFLFIFSVMALSQTVSAAVSMTPAVAGYSSGSYSAAAGTFSTAANGASYGASGVISVGGKPITVPASLRMASNAGQYAKNAMRLNPWAIVGTLAAGYLLDQGIEYLDGQWQKDIGSTPLYDGNYWSNAVTGGICQYPATSTCDVLTAAKEDAMQAGCSGGVCDWRSISPCVFNPASASCDGERLTSVGGSWVNYPITVERTVRTASAAVPLFPEDWDALPDPLPLIAPELPDAPYMPEGAPVEAPNYDFAPIDVPVGDPYTKPDGSTAQPKAKVSPNGDSVTVDTYDQPLTAPNGDPVPNPTPQDTPEPTQSECEKHPATIGCSEYGTPGAPESLTTLTVPLNPDYSAIGGAGACPASVTVAGITWSYQPFCDFATAIKPLVLGFAWLSFAFIVVGTVRI